MTLADVSPYEVLGVALDATEEEVRRAYREKAKQLHPDRGGNHGGSSGSSSEHGKAEGDEAFVRVQRAYEALRQPEARRKLDAETRAAQLAAAGRAARALEVNAEDLLYDEEEDEVEGVIVGMWRYECRCGDEFALSGAELESDAPVPCRSCSLMLHVVRREQGEGRPQRQPQLGCE